MRLEWPEITEEIFEDDSNAGTFLLGKGWIPLILIVHEYSAKVYGFSQYIGHIDVTIVDTATIVSTENDNEVIIRVKQALYKP